MFKILKDKLWSKNWYTSPVILFSMLLFFWGLFDAILSYSTPIIMEENGMSLTMIGIIIGTSSITGAIFDYIFCRIFKNHEYRFVFMIMFVLCFIYPLLLMGSKTIWLFIIAMGVWGIYFDLSRFGIFNFVGRHTIKEHHVATFGAIQMILSMAYVIGPLIAGYMIVESVNIQVYATSWLFIGFSFLFFLTLIFSVKNIRKNDPEHRNISHVRSSLLEIKIWKKLAKSMNPALFLTFFIVFIEAYFWTLSPIFVEEANFGWYGGLFLTAFIIPSLFMGVFVERVTKKIGTKKTAVFGLLISSFILVPFFLFSNPIISIIIVFVSSCFTSLSLPAINASYADRISQSPQYDSEIESLEDFLHNIGYIIGPISAGFLADNLHIPLVFSLLGAIGVLLTVSLLIFLPKKDFQN